MSDKKFNAILAKNAIARLVCEYLGDYEPLNAAHIIGELKAIEEYLGYSNQPTAEEIYRVNYEEKGQHNFTV